MIAKKILIVDDEESICSLLEDVLEEEGYFVITCQNTDDGYARIMKSLPDVVILDVKVPRVGGLELCRLLRENAQTKDIPIIMLTVQSSETDKVIGLEVGADDYIVKPFSSKELLARINSLLRRVHRKPESEILKSGVLEINVTSQSVTINKKTIELRPKEYDLLLLFLRKQNVVLDRSYILENIFGYKVPVNTRTIDTHIKNLRRNLGPFGKKIKTVFGRGFKFAP